METLHSQKRSKRYNLELCSGRGVLLGSRLEALLRLNDLRVCDGLRSQLNLDLLQLLSLAHDALQALLQDVLAESPTAVNGDGAEAVQPTRPFLHAQHPKKRSPTAETPGRSTANGSISGCRREQHTPRRWLDPPIAPASRGPRRPEQESTAGGEYG